MDKHLELQARIAQIKASGEIAPPNTWITSYSVKKNSKRYTYYRLMKADPSRSQGKVRGKMVKYLGSKDSQDYRAMQQAIQRRNQLQVLLRQLQSLERVSGGKKPKQPPLTPLVLELMAQVQALSHLVQEIQRSHWATSRSVT
jgi:hypothetical protein